VAYRCERRRLEAARQAQDRLVKRLQELEEQVETLTVQVQQLGRGDPGQTGSP
jgi:hypothetical protein